MSQRDPYGVMWANGGPCTVHRLAYTILVGPIADGLCVCHRCDNPPCFNPEHLFLGSHADNVRDMDDKGRRKTGVQTGERSNFAKLSDQQVYEIRLLVGEGWKQGRVASMYGVWRQHVNLLCRGHCRADS